MKKVSDSNSSLQKVAAPPSLREMAYLSIKEAIITKTLEPGVIYNEQGLAKELGMSKTPVHEALIDLANRGFVTLLSRRGVRINILTTEDIINLYSFRLLIEGAMLRSISDTFEEAHIDNLLSLHKKCLDAKPSNGMVNYLKLERTFHDYLASLSQNSYMINALSNIRDLIDWMGMTALSRIDRMAEVNREHDEIIGFLTKRDFEGAAISMEKHIRITLENVLRHQLD
ncbi:MAG: GntR family transcriptional regulator [Desulfotignum sp.]|jgi:DNA-binding GntR family transcriptional regulator|nr:GntR family transcriptional regulator [Desulfotignum sp.]MCF8088485.1 GntR family transcriptional regulator [Desulfotignum sp.]MCF8137273.1 GntR family transcriptional regulator [Desulfotignum sp.]